MDINVIFSFWLVSILFVLTPGADWAYTISAGIAGDKIIPAVSGLLLGHLIAALIVVVGLGAIFSFSCDVNEIFNLIWRTVCCLNSGFAL